MMLLFGSGHAGLRVVFGQRITLSKQHVQKLFSCFLVQGILHLVQNMCIEISIIGKNAA
jgi:hypothetical protein